MGGLNSKALREGPIIGYAQTHSRSQVHEVAVIPLTVPNFPDSSCPAFARLHEIYCTCPRVRQHFAHNMDAPLQRDAFYKQVVVEASHPALPYGTPIPVAVATRWRGDEQWDIAGFVGCRGFSSHGELNDVNLLQMFFRDGHKVPLTMPAIQLAAKLFTEMNAAAQEDPTKPTAAPSTPWPRNVEWTIRRHNMEVRRVLEAVLVFWGLRPARTSVNEPAYEFYRRLPPHLLAMLAKEAGPDAAPFSTFPLELRSMDDERITVGSRDPIAIASLMNDLAGWASGPSRWLHGCVPSAGLETLLPSNFATHGRVLTTGLSMNFRGTQQKTPQERRDILGATVADQLELVQPATKEGEEKHLADDDLRTSTPVRPNASSRGGHFPSAPTPVMDPRLMFMHAQHHQQPMAFFNMQQPHLQQPPQAFAQMAFPHAMPQQQQTFMFAQPGFAPPQPQQYFALPPQQQPMFAQQQAQQVVFVDGNGMYLAQQPPQQQNVIYVVQQQQPQQQQPEYSTGWYPGAMSASNSSSTTVAQMAPAKPLFAAAQQQQQPLLSLPYQGPKTA